MNLNCRQMISESLSIIIDFVIFSPLGQNPFWPFYSNNHNKPAQLKYLKYNMNRLLC